jgi:hypothetical protein
MHFAHRRRAKRATNLMWVFTASRQRIAPSDDFRGKFATAIAADSGPADGDWTLLDHEAIPADTFRTLTGPRGL